MNADHDIIIVGGGPVGATLALALRGYGLAVTVLEARAAGTPSRDARVLALAPGSRLILQHLGVWAQLEAQATPIATIHVSQRGCLGRTILHAEEAGMPALGYVLPYAALSDALDRALLNADGIRVLHGARATAVVPAANAATVHYERDGTQHEAGARLLALADGGRSLTDPAGLQRQVRDYGHSAVVAQVQCELPHSHVAFERFTPAGPLALLPLGECDFALVWTAEHALAQALCELGEAEFLERLHRHFGDRVGRFLAVSGRATFPLKLSTLRPVTAPHLAVIGNAAQTLHPVAGQGFNLGLRDAWELAQLLQRTARTDIGAADMLASYRTSRRMDTGGGILFTDFLVRAFSNAIPGFGPARSAGLALAEMAAPIKHFIARKMSFGARG